jgi:hypothetical protein
MIWKTEKVGKEVIKNASDDNVSWTLHELQEYETCSVGDTEMRNLG